MVAASAGMVRCTSKRSVMASILAGTEVSRGAAMPGAGRAAKCLVDLEQAARERPEMDPVVRRVRGDTAGAIHCPVDGGPHADGDRSRPSDDDGEPITRNSDDGRPCAGQAVEVTHFPDAPVLVVPDGREEGEPVVEQGSLLGGGIVQAHIRQGHEPDAVVIEPVAVGRGRE